MALGPAKPTLWPLDTPIPSPYTYVMVHMFILHYNCVYFSVMYGEDLLVSSRRASCMLVLVLCRVCVCVYRVCVCECVCVWVPCVCLWVCVCLRTVWHARAVSSVCVCVCVCVYRVACSCCGEVIVASVNKHILSLRRLQQVSYSEQS